MSLITRMMKQSAVYWALKATDKFGSGGTFAAPVQIACRWEDVSPEKLTPEQEILNINAKVYVSIDVTLKGYLLLGTLVSGMTTNPLTYGAHQILQFSKNPNLRARNFVRTAFLKVSWSAYTSFSMDDANLKATMKRLYTISGEYAKGMENGLVAASEELLKDSTAIVPVDTGYLRASVFIQKVGSGFKTLCKVGYAATYAVYVHEVWARHAPGTSWKFLETPLKRNAKKYMKIIRDKAQRRGK